MTTSNQTWEQTVVAALRGLGGQAHLSAIYDVCEADRKALSLPLSATFEATVRRTLQQSEQCTQAAVRGSGIWRIAEDIDEA